MKSSNYLFATGKIRYLETKLLNQTDLERIIDAPDINSAFRVFYDTDYAEHLFERKPDEFETVILDDLLENKKLLFQIVPDKDLIKFLLLEYDFYNLKVIFKEKLFKEDFDYLLIPLGYFDISTLKKIILENEKIKIDQEIYEVINEANNYLTEKLLPYQIEFFFDRKYFSLFKKLAKKLKNQFIIGFANLRIDLTNLKIFLRLKNLKKDVEVLKEALVGSGKIKTEDFINFYDKDLEIAFKYFSKFLPPQFEKYTSEYLEGKKLWLLEKRFMRIGIDYLKRAKYIAYGPEIVVAYFYTKKNINRNVRLIMNGKMNEIDREILRERIWDLY